MVIRLRPIVDGISIESEKRQRCRQTDTSQVYNRFQSTQVNTTPDGHKNFEKESECLLSKNPWQN